MTTEERLAEAEGRIEALEHCVAVLTKSVKLHQEAFRVIFKSPLEMTGERCYHEGTEAAE